MFFFAIFMDKRIKALSEGQEPPKSGSNPVIGERVAELIREMDKKANQNLDIASNKRYLARLDAKNWVKATAPHERREDVNKKPGE